VQPIEPESQQRINVVIELRAVIEELRALLETRAARTGNGRAVEGTAAKLAALIA
jgi:hypothetical protein